MWKKTSRLQLYPGLGLVFSVLTLGSIADGLYTVPKKKLVAQQLNLTKRLHRAETSG